MTKLYVNDEITLIDGTLFSLLFGTEKKIVQGTLETRENTSWKRY
jgi:hypothetical protein